MSLQNLIKISKIKVYLLFLVIGLLLGVAGDRFYQAAPYKNFFIKFQGSDPAYIKKLGNVFGKAYFDLFNDHNQFLDAFYKLKAERKLDNSTKTFIIFDSHQDTISGNVKFGTENIGNWVNQLITQKNKNGSWEIDTIYWVLPNDTSLPIASQDDTGRETAINNGQRNSLVPFKDQDIYVNNETGELYFSKTLDKNVHVVHFYKRHIEGLPTFPDAKEVLMTIDSDYFDFNGVYQGHNFVVHNSSEEELDQKLTDFVRRLDKANLKPVFVGISRSPEFTAGMSQPLEVFYRHIGLISRTGTDYVVGYVHHNNSDEIVTREMLDEITTRAQVENSQDLYDLQTVDIIYGGFDYVIDVRHDSRELSKAVDILMLHDHISKKQALDRLKKLAGKDGKLYLPNRRSNLF